MPLMIYVYSFISGFGYWSLILGRLLSVLFILVTAILIYNFLRKRTGNTAIPNLFLVFYFLNAFFIDWALTIKIYALSSFLLTLAVLECYKVAEGENIWKHLFFSGLLFSLLFLSRIVFVVNIFVYLIFALYIVYTSHAEHRIKHASAVITGLLLPLLVFILIYRTNLSAIYSNVVEEPMMITNYVRHSYLNSTFKLILYFLLPQNLLLLVILLISGFKYSLFEKFLLFNIVGYFLIHLPTQMLPEYLSNISPIFIMLVVLRCNKSERNMRKVMKRRNLNPKLWIMILYVIFIPFGVAHLKHVIEDRPLMPNPVQMHAISESINSLEGKTILSSWEGYPACSNKTSVFKERYLPVFDQAVGDTALISKFKMTSTDDSKKFILAKIPDVIIYDSEEPRTLEGLSDLINTEYKPVYKYKYLTVYKK